jgi:uncharacterized protein (DUF488 family)
MSAADKPVFTIGHSVHSTEAFLSLLRQHGVEAIADVRSIPYSRFNPQFNRDILERYLNENGVLYVFLGKELGARTDDRSCYERGQVQYSRLVRTPLFLSGLDRVQQDAQAYRIALMCAEKEPLECHRTLLVAKALFENGQAVSHIHADGRLETYEAAMDRLLDLTGVPREDLFRSRQELLVEALARQERNIAYVDARSVLMVRKDIP